MPPTVKHISGTDNIDNIVATLNDALKTFDSVFVLFCGSKNEKGESWCPDCVKAEPVVNAEVASLSSTVAFFHCDVGPREVWKNQNNPLRHHSSFKLTGVPTLLKWGTAQRLVEEQLLDKQMLKMMLEED